MASAPLRLIADTAGLMRGLHGAIALVILASSAPSAHAQESQPDQGQSYRRSLNVGLGRFEGDYGLPQGTTFDVVNFDARWYLTRGQLQVSVPYLRLDAPAGIQLVGGQPVVIAGQAGNRRKESGLGDASLQGQYYLKTGSTTTKNPWVIGTLRVKLPTGNEDDRLGTGATDVEIGVGLIKQYSAVTWLADFGYTVTGSSSTFDLKNVLRIGTGVSRSFNARTSGFLYLENRTKAVEQSEDQRTLIVGVERSLDEAQRMQLSVSVLLGLTDATEDAGVYLNLGRKY